MESQPQNPEFRNNPELSPIYEGLNPYTVMKRSAMRAGST